MMLSWGQKSQVAVPDDSTPLGRCEVQHTVIDRKVAEKELLGNFSQFPLSES